MAPPELAGDTPVLDVFEPLVIRGGPVFRHEPDLAVAHHIERGFGDRLARVIRALGRRLAHGDEPLIREHRLQHHTGAVAARHHQLVRLDGFEQADGFEICHYLLACFEAIEAAILLRRVVVDFRVEREDFDLRQAVTLADLIVVQIVRGRHLDHAGTEFAIDVVVGDHRDFAVSEWQPDHFADQLRIAFVFGMDHYGDVAEHGFRTRGGDRQMTGAVRERVLDVPQVAVFFLAGDFEIGDRGHEDRIPVDEAFAAIDQALFIETDEHVAHGGGHLVVHGEVFAGPVDRRTEATHLARDGGTGLLLPFPDTFDKFFAAEVMARDALRVELAFDDDLRGDARVIGAGHPQGIFAEHAVIAREAVHDRLIEGMAHMQGARDVWRRQLDREVLAVLVERGGGGIAAFFPLRAPLGFDVVGLETLGKRAVAHCWKSAEMRWNL